MKTIIQTLILLALFVVNPFVLSANPQSAMKGEGCIFLIANYATEQAARGMAL